MPPFRTLNKSAGKPVPLNEVPAALRDVRDVEKVNRCAFSMYVVFAALQDVE